MKKKYSMLYFLWLSLSIAHGQAPNPIRNTDLNFFPLAVWHQSSSNAGAYKENGINLFISLPKQFVQEDLNNLKRADMKIIARQNEFGLTQLHEPSIVGWMHGDEPDNAQRNKQDKNKWDPCRDPAEIIRNYYKIKENDPSRPVYLNLGRGVAVTNWVGRGECRGNTAMYKTSNEGYLKGCDIASFDVYPVNSREDDVRGKLWYVAKGIDNLLEWSDYSKPVWCWIETTRISEKSFRKPTPSEVKSEVWMALIHGAKGIGYFCHSFSPTTVEAALLKDKEMLQSVKTINEQISSLARILNSPNTSGYAIVDQSNASVPIDIMTKKDHESNYIFAVAMREGQVDATFTVTSGSQVEVLGENRNIEVKEGKFTDNFSSYGVHLYKITE